MDPTLSDDLRSIQATARRFAAERIAPEYMTRETAARGVHVALLPLYS